MSVVILARAVIAGAALIVGSAALNYRVLNHGGPHMNVLARALLLIVVLAMSGLFIWMVVT